MQFHFLAEECIRLDLIAVYPCKSRRVLDYRRWTRRERSFSRPFHPQRFCVAFPFIARTDFQLSPTINLSRPLFFSFLFACITHNVSQVTLSRRRLFKVHALFTPPLEITGNKFSGNEEFVFASTPFQICPRLPERISWRTCPQHISLLDASFRKSTTRGSVRNSPRDNPFRFHLTAD